MDRLDRIIKRNSRMYDKHFDKMDKFWKKHFAPRTSDKHGNFTPATMAHMLGDKDWCWFLNREKQLFRRGQKLRRLGKSLTKTICAKCPNYRKENKEWNSCNKEVNRMECPLVKKVVVEKDYYFHNRAIKKFLNKMV